MLQGGTQVSEMIPMSDFTFARPDSSFGLDQTPLETKRDNGLGTFDPEMGQYRVEELFGDGSTRNPRVGVAGAPFASVSCSSANQAPAGDTATERFLKFDQKRRVAVRDFDLKPESRSFDLSCPDDGHATVSIENTGEIPDVTHQIGLSARNGMVANSVELRCPARKGAEGQYRAKQERGGAPGVCNEHVPPAKAKMCSALTRNREKSAEMTDSLDTQGTYQKVTVKSRRNNQGDRQCPAGRAYLIRTEDTRFMVDPRYLFEWTAPLTYPDQLAFTRICGLRFFLKTDRRMYQAVFDGITA